MITADIHSFESLAALDGEGLRYAVFFTGCPLRCVYCHNPDTWFKSGNIFTPLQLAEKIRRYKPYFKNGGGVTFSGGEPLLNAEFINETAPLLKKEEIGYCLDTSGSVELTESVKKCIDFSDMVILDLKFSGREDYEKYTGGKFENFVNIGKYCSENGKRLWLRTVIAPGINDSEQAVSEYKKFSSLFKYEKYELLAFHTMGFFKYDNLKIENPLKNVSALSHDRLSELQKIIDKA
ncbi:MAG: radical SAM protein [Clostridiales bacterium]|nr:radical SAM protein [Clostridiales bacterium]